MSLSEIIFWISSFLIVYSYAIYPLFLYLLYKPDPIADVPVRSEDLPHVSLVIAAYNEEKVIQSRLENCLALDYPKDKLEIIIASDGSDDRTNEIVRSYSDKGIVLFDYQDRRGKVNVLNETVPQVKHAIVAFSDANTMFKNDALRKLVAPFEDVKIGCVCGGLQFINAAGSKTGELEGFYWRYETMLKKMEGARGSLLGANGGIFAVRKELFVQCPSDTIVEDFFLPMKILQNGHYVVYEPHASAIEEAAHKIVQEKERRIRIGAGDFQALFRLLPMLNPLRGFPALAFWSHKVLRWCAPFFLIISFVTNLFLLSNIFYLMLFMLQILFYLCAVMGRILSHAQKNIRFFNLCYYFVSMNSALFLGFCRYVANKQNVAWQRTER